MSSPESAPPPGSRGASEAVSWSVRVGAAWTWRLLVIGFGIYVLVEAFARVELVAFSFVLAIFFTAVLHPLEMALRRIPGPRSISALLALLIGLAVLGGIATFVTLQISEHANELGDQVTSLVDHTESWLRNGPLHLKSNDLKNISDNLQKAVQDHQDALITGAIATVQTVVEVVGALLLILFSTFFLLRDGEQIWKWTLKLLPAAAHDRVDLAGRAGWGTVGGYMRGQVIIALFHSISVMIVLFVLGVPLAAALGVLIFLGSFVPLIGLTVTGALATAVAALEHGLTAGIVVAAAIIILVQLEGNLLQPLIMSRSVQVHPLAIALSVLTGTLLAGIVGALLAVPLVAFLNTTVHALRQTPGLPIGDSGFPITTTDEPFGDPVDSAVAPDADNDNDEDAAEQDDASADEPAEDTSTDS